MFVHSHRTLTLPTHKWHCLCLCTLTELSRCLPPNGAVCVCALSQNSLTAYPQMELSVFVHSHRTLSLPTPKWRPGISYVSLLSGISWLSLIPFPISTFVFPPSPPALSVFLFFLIMIPSPDIFQKISNIFREEIGFLYGSESC